MSFHPDGRQLVSGGYDKVVRLYDVARGGDAIKTFEGHQALVSRAVFSPHVSLLSVTSLCDSHAALSFQCGPFRLPSVFFSTRCGLVAGQVSDYRFQGRDAKNLGLDIRGLHTNTEKASRCVSLPYSTVTSSCVAHLLVRAVALAQLLDLDCDLTCAR